MDTTPPRLRRAYFECRHGQLHVHNAIPVGGGFDELTTLICLHGAAGTGRMFLEVSKRLGSSRSIYSPDLPGCGESDASAAALPIAGFADAIADFLDSMRFRQIDLLGVGAGSAVAVEIAIARPKIVRKLCLLGVPGKEAASAGSGAQGLQGAAAGWQADRRQLVTQPVLSIADETSIESAAPAIAGKLNEFLGA
ncbi:MAG TPA: alpha/beta fold hydrolase [Steroidobacteraceae bacterium]|nr:alpha/beta fold hydrolase [Steroidobacteraceae bacterium]